MDAPASRQSDPHASWPEAGPDGRIVFLVEACSRLERRLIERWIEAERPTGRSPESIEIVSIPPARRRARRKSAALEAELDSTLAPLLATDDDPLMAPLRVMWRGRIREDAGRSRREVSLLELLTIGDPRDPNWIRQTWVSRRHPDRCLVVAGEPAPASDLRRRWIESSGPASGEVQGFPLFVAQKATLALERAERGIRGARYKVPRLVHEEILGRPSFRGGLARLFNEQQRSGEGSRSLAALAHEAAKDLREIAAAHSPLVIDLVNQLIHRLYTRGYHEKLVYDDEIMSGIAALEERHPVVFLPTHKQNLDHLVLQYALHEKGLPPNHTAGGDNMNFFPLGPLVRRSGVFFIRRSFKDDAVYKHVLASYIDYLIEKRFPLEWYIEGGRSRSGKLLPPRYGLLANVVDAYRRGKSEDVYLVPVSIAYDQILDLSSYVAEQRGARKEREGLSWLLGWLRRSSGRYGKIHLDFGEPLSLRAHFGAPGGSSSSSSGKKGEKGAEDESDERSLALQKLAFEVSVRINRVTPITPTSLVTLALLGTTGQALTVPETRRSLKNLLDIVQARALPTTAEFQHLETDAGIAYTLEALVENDVVTRFDEGLETVYGIGDGQQLAAAYYRNTIVHFFVASAITELAMLHATEHPRDETLPRFWDEVMRLRDLLKFEFFFPEKEAFREEIRGELDLNVRGWEKRIAEFEISPEDLVRRARPFCAHRVLRPFLESYQVVADRLASLDVAEPLDEKAFFSDCLGLGRQYALQRRIQGADSVSKALFQTALRLAKNRDLVEPAAEGLGEDLREARRAFAGEIRDAVRRVDIIVALAAERRAGFLR